MKKFWVRVNGKYDLKQDATATAVYGDSLHDALSYAWTYMVRNYKINIVQVFDKDMNLLHECEM